MLGAERERELRRLLSEQGSLRISVQAKRFGVSEETIRRDIKRLAADGVADPVFGGAVLKGSGAQGIPPVAERRQEGAKAAIGEAAARLIHPGEVVILDAGTTTLALARRLSIQRDLTVVTNSLAVAGACAELTGITTHVIGGRLVAGSLSMIGPQAERDLAGMRADWAFLGAAAIEVGGALTSADPYEAAVKQAMIGAAQRTVILADATKFGTRRLATFALAEDIDFLVTTANCPPEVKPWLDAAGASLLLCEAEESQP
jgi:DeoR/GlpR family transcriptional regulator of sugar metabolism